MGPDPSPGSFPEFVPSNQLARKEFFSSYRKKFGSLRNETVTNLTEILDFIRTDESIEDIRYVAYVLATIKHETNNSFKPLNQVFLNKDQEQNYEPGTRLGKSMGNTDPGDGARYRGRGYVQLTGRANYKRMSKALDLVGTKDDLVLYPEKALEPQIAYRILSVGMITGYFTGKKFADFIGDDKTDYFNARRMVNALDKAALIANYAKNFEEILLHGFAIQENVKTAN